MKDDECECLEHKLSKEDVIGHDREFVLRLFAADHCGAGDLDDRRYDIATYASPQYNLRIQLATPVKPVIAIASRRSKPSVVSAHAMSLLRQT